MTVTEALRSSLRALREARSSRNLPLPVTPLHQFNDFIGFNRIDALQRKFMPGA